MPVAYRSASQSQADTGAQLSINKPAGVVEGDLMVMVEIADRDGSLTNITNPQGWTVIESYDANRTTTGAARAWYRIASAGESNSYALGTNSLADTAVNCIAFQAGTFDPVTPIGQIAWLNTTSASTTYTAPSIGGQDGAALVCSFMASEGSTVVRSWSGYTAGLTEVADIGGSDQWVGMATAYQILTSNVDTGQKTATGSDSSTNKTASIRINPVPATGTTSAIVVQSSTKATADATSLTCTKPAGVANTDVLYAFHMCDDAAPTGNPGTGWVSLGLINVGSRYHQVWRKIITSAGTEPASYTFAATAGASHSVIILRISGVSNTTPEDISSVSNNQTTASTNGTALGVTTVTPGALLLCAWGNRAGSSAPNTVPPGTMTEYQDTARQYAALMVAGEFRPSSGATGNRVATSNNDTWSNWTLALRPGVNAVSEPLSATASASATIATTGGTRSRVFAETMTMTDQGSVIRTAAPANDVMSMTDKLTIELSKGFPETMTMTDSLSITKNVQRTLGERMSMSDALEIEFIRGGLQNYQFIMTTEPYVPFGHGTAINLINFDPGSVGVRNQDSLHPRGDSRHFGTDYREPPTWGWELHTDVRDPADALVWADNLAEVWDNAVRTTPSGVMELKYRVADRTRIVYGRPRRFTPSYDKIQLGKVYLTCDFDLSEDTYYDEDEETFTAQMSPAAIEATGIQFPLIFPIRFARVLAPKTGLMQVFGSRKTWITATFYGPSINPYVQIGDTRFGLKGSIPQGQTIRLSGRPWDMGAYRSSGAWDPGVIDPRTRLSQLQISPGQYSVTYGAIDNTGTSKVLLKWHNANRTL